MIKNRTPAVIVLENGETFTGKSFGYETDGFGEVCFNTSMTGYQEILTDPSYNGQIVTLTYPMIGNYGINKEYSQSAKIQATGLIIKEYVGNPSNFMSEKALHEFLIEQKIPAIERVDTRRLVLTLRNAGAMRGGIFVGREYSSDMLDAVRALPQMSGLDLASGVSTDKPYVFGNPQGKKFRIGVFDFGVKTNILRNLDKVGFAVEVLPAKTDYETVVKMNFDCFFISNGPGDPEPLNYAVETIRKLMSDAKPIFGICLGHQLMGLASGRQTYKLKFGHRGGNQPVKDFATGRVEITAQNHGFAVRDVEVPDMKVSQINLNDKTVEGFKHKGLPILSVQYHPEAAPGPNDSLHIFSDFYRMVGDYYAGKGR